VTLCPPSPAIGPDASETRVTRLAYSPDEAAAALGVSRDFLDEHVMPELRVIRKGRRRLIPVRELERWVRETASFAVGGERCR
jgi:excisionase family DNA binding protein